MGCCYKKQRCRLDKTYFLRNIEDSWTEITVKEDTNELQVYVIKPISSYVSRIFSTTFVSRSITFLKVRLFACHPLCEQFLICHFNLILPSFSCSFSFKVLLLLIYFGKDKPAEMAFAVKNTFNLSPSALSASVIYPIRLLFRSSFQCFRNILYNS